MDNSGGNVSRVSDAKAAKYTLEEVDAQASSGHKLGQIIGDWFQDDFVRPILQGVADRLGLYLDHRLRSRDARGEKILWNDDYDNAVDYDFVMELDGSDSERGVPVAFLECFWRRGSRHSKDKARDDSGKLVPMRHTYPAARFLGIVASGDFTRPAMELIRSREIDLFYIPKAKVIEAFSKFKLKMDYPDKASEGKKSAIADAFCAALTPDIKLHVAESLRALMTEAVVQGYADRVKANLSALPQEVRIMGQRRSAPAVFESVDEAEEFLAKSPLTFDFAVPTEAYTYEVTYSDGMEFSKLVGTLDELRDLNASIKRLADHMRSLIKA